MKSLSVIILILILAAFTGCSSAGGDDDDTTGDDDDDQIAADTAVINIINNTGYKTRFLLAESDELVFYDDTFEIYSINTPEENYTDVIIEPGINNSESYTLGLGNEQTAVRDWALQYVDPDFVLEWRGQGHELMDRFVFQAGKTYTITITFINLDMFHIDFTISCNADPVVKAVNRTGDTCWFVLTGNDDCIYFNELGGTWEFGNGYNGLMRPDEPENWGEGTSEIANGIPENFIIDLGTDTSVLMDWGLYYLAAGGDMQAPPGELSEENDRYEFERGKTYIVNINELSVGSSDYSITEY
jgi:hypothetical protein